MWIKRCGCQTPQRKAKTPSLHQWVGPYKIIDLNKNNAKLEIKPNKFKIINISRLKAFHEEKEKRLSQDKSRLSPSLFQDSHKLSS
jgi:hypothetical protein